MISGRVTVLELPSGVVVRNVHGERVYPIDLIHAAFHDAVCACARVREIPDNGLNPDLLDDLERMAKTGEDWIATIKADELKAALGIPPEEW
jgi:hypothetical protein